MTYIVSGWALNSTHSLTYSANSNDQIYISFYSLLSGKVWVNQ